MQGAQFCLSVLGILLLCVTLEMLSSTPVPVFDGEAGNFASYQQEVDLWMMITQVPMNRRAPALALAMDKMPREVCLGLGNDVLKSDFGVEKITDALHKDIAPDAHDSAFRDVVVFFGLRRTHETPDEYLALFQRALRRIEARLPDGAMFPEIIVSSLRLHHAGLSPHQKSLVLASTGGDTSLETMKKHMRRILQPCGVDLKRDALIVNNDLKVMRAASSYPDDSNVKVDMGEAQVASKKKRKNKTKKGRDPNQQPRLSEALKDLENESFTKPPRGKMFGK